jgi:uncharacterized protein (TIGR03000 family)
MNALISLKVVLRQAVAAGLLFACCLTAAAEQPEQAPAEITLVVPAGAKVFFDGAPTRSTGTERLYVSPPLVSGKKHHYVVLVRWQEDGKPVERTRKVPVAAGARVRVDFTAPGEEKGTEPAVSKTAPVGTLLSPAGYLLRRDKVPGDEWKFDWKPIGEKEGLEPEVLYLGLPGAVLASKNGGVQMTLRTDLFSPLPILEPAVVLHDSADFDLDFTLDRGRVDLVNRKKEGPARVRIRAWGEEWVATLDKPGAALVLEVVGRWRAGTAFTDKPGPEYVPTADLLFLVAAGDVYVKHRGTQFALSAPPGPALIGWNNFIGMDPTPQRLEKLPAWAEFPKDEKTMQLVQKLLGIRDRLVEGVRTRGIGPTLDDFLKSKDEWTRRAGVVYIGATDDLVRMGKVIHEFKDPDTFNEAVRVMRHWLGRAPGQDQRFYKGLIAVKDYKPAQAAGLIEMLYGFDEAEQERPELYQMLINYLVEGHTAMRGMAHYHLIRLVPAGSKIPYDWTASREEREKARKEWKKLVPPGTVPKPEKAVQP